MHGCLAIDCYREYSYVCVLSIVKQPIAIGMGIMNVATYLNGVCYLQQQVYKLL